ncbi:DinB family protein [Alkalihalophilus marmarensis]|uniref:DinB family protein n=1 Tax=Alkalihalophilus marmarensis TaxID=521377 RepID=UPI00203C97ED|nr:DinB family protein [Alkalihalophilus marmarensis]MCM3490650.1 DinB family protein [Alkalihalophilus marmarensis]
MHDDKAYVLIQYVHSIEFVQSLEHVTDQEWCTAISIGKWTVAEIVGHLIPWDQFVIDKRLPYLLTNKPLPIGPDAHALNEQSASLSRRLSKQTMISQFISTRNHLHNKVQDIANEYWKTSIIIGTSTLTLNDYLIRLTQHDLHHFAQIRSALSKCKLEMEDLS